MKSSRCCIIVRLVSVWNAGYAVQVVPGQDRCHLEHHQACCRRGDQQDRKFDTSVACAHLRLHSACCLLQIGNRVIRKRIHVRIEHVQPSRCREEFLRRKADNDRVKSEAKARGGTHPCPLTHATINPSQHTLRCGVSAMGVGYRQIGSSPEGCMRQRQCVQHRVVLQG
jgi:hypothetical protein